MGPSFNSPPMPIDENKRSPSSHEFKADTQRWKNEDLAEFDPERWLTHNADGQVAFDGRAAPQQMFGAGIRSCFGRKLGYLEMRIIYTLLIWKFELLPTPKVLMDLNARDGVTHQPQNVHVRLGLVGAA
jgi:cytochrome P450